MGMAHINGFLGPNTSMNDNLSGYNMMQRLNGRGDNDAGPYSLNGRGDNDAGPYSLNGRGDNDAGPYSLNGVDDPATNTGHSTMMLVGVSIATLLAGLAAGYFVFHKK